MPILLAKDRSAGASQSVGGRKTPALPPLHCLPPTPRPPPPSVTGGPSLVPHCSFYRLPASCRLLPFVAKEGAQAL